MAAIARFCRLVHSWKSQTPENSAVTNEPGFAGDPTIVAGGRAVFISYASEDMDAAQRTCAALRAAGIEVWFDQSDLRGGEAWDAAIRKQIRACALFIPVISANTSARAEGYFRLEWKLAVDRSHLMAAEKAFLLPVVIDGSREADALVPDRFREVQWSYLPAGEAPPAFIERVTRLLPSDARITPTTRLPATGGGGSQAAPPERGVAPAERGIAPPARPAALRRRIWLTLAFGVAVLIAGALIRFSIQNDSFWRSPLASARVSGFSDLEGIGNAAAISRDGKSVAFVTNRGARTDVWVTQIGSGTYRDLTHGDLRVVVNPQVRTLGFSADSSLVSIWTRRSDGSKPEDVTVLAVPTLGGSLQPYLRPAAEFDWSHDGKRLVFHTTAPGDPLFVRESGTLGDHRIYVAPAGVHCHFPLWSPDDAFIYFARGIPPDHWDIWRIRPSGAGLERLTSHDTRVAYPVVLDRRTLLYLATSVDGSGPWMYAMDIERRVPHRISFGLERYTSLSANADGTRLVATLANPRTSVWHLSLTNQEGAQTPALSPSSISMNGATPRLGPNYVLYVASQGGRQGLWTLTQGTAREIWSSANAVIVDAPAVAQDGRRIAFTVRDSDKTLLYVINSDGSHARVVADSLPLRGSIAWAPDQQSIVAAVVRDGEPRLTRIFLNGEPALPLVSEYSVDPVWSPDGRFFVYSGADIGTTFPLRAAAEDGRPHSLPNVMLTRGARRVAFSHEGQSLVILRGDIGHKNLWVIDLQSGSEQMLAELPADFSIGDFDISADGSEIVFDRIEEKSDLALIERPQ
jgi:Tol biopolymer transport system component